MKTHWIRISMLAALAAGLVQAQSAKLTADVPFQFVVNNQTLPAGPYHVDVFTNISVVKIQPEDGRPIALMANNTSSWDPQKVSKLVFHRYGNRYFLAEIWTRGSDSGRQIAPTNLERELKAQKSMPRSQVLVAMR